MKLSDLKKDLIIKALTKTKGDAFEAWRLVYPSKSVSYDSFVNNLYRDIKVRLSDFTQPGKKKVEMYKVETIILSQSDIRNLIEREYNQGLKESDITFNYKVNKDSNKRVLNNITFKIIEI